MGCGNSKDMIQAAKEAAETVTDVGQRTLEHGVQRAKNVFAKPIQGLFGDDGMPHTAPPMFAKTDEERNFLQVALPKNFCFEQLSGDELQQLVDAMEQITVEPNEVVIQQGSDGDFFYVIYKGMVHYTVDGANVGSGSAGDSFGELSLLYTTPRAATVTADAGGGQVILYRVDQLVFRYILQQQSLSESQAKIALLKKVKFFTDNLDEYSIHKVANVMLECRFATGTVIMKKGDTDANVLYILQQGAVQCTDVAVGDAQYQNVQLSTPGDCFGERALITGEPRAATVTATKDTICYTIDKQTFESVLGDFTTAIMKTNDSRKLAAIKVIADSGLSAQTITALCDLIVDRTFPKGTNIYEAGKSVDAALYLVRTGSVTIHQRGSCEFKAVGTDGYFGDDQLLVDVGLVPDSNETTKNDNNQYSLGARVPIVPSYTVTASTTEDVTCGVLTVAAVRTVLDTRYIGQPPMARDSIVEKGIPLPSLKRHKVLGAGTFGIVFLVSRENAIGQSVAYALKVQSKYELCQSGQAKAVVHEKKIMSKLRHPFLIGLVQSYQDADFVYLLLQLVQGGELYSYIHTLTRHSLPELDARFYAACVAEGLGFMHRNGYIYRDLKPENVLVDSDGYCVIIDFGFAKYVPDPEKTFTLCGTPLYLPPEVILNRGHGGSADHWSLGVLIYEMLTGDTPFYKSGMGQMDLFRSIVKGNFDLPAQYPRSSAAGSIISEFLNRNPAKRLGSLANGEDGIAQHAWFMNVIDFNELRQKQITAPRLPQIKNPLDASNFEDWSHLEDKTKMKFPRVSAEDDAQFHDF